MTNELHINIRIDEYDIRNIIWTFQRLTGHLVCPFRFEVKQSEEIGGGLSVRETYILQTKKFESINVKLRKLFDLNLTIIIWPLIRMYEWKKMRDYNNVSLWKHSNTLFLPEDVHYYQVPPSVTVQWAQWSPLLTQTSPDCADLGQARLYEAVITLNYLWIISKVYKYIKYISSKLDSSPGRAYYKLVLCSMVPV